MPQRIQLKRTKGWRMPAGAVKVDRSTKWGNPAVVGKPFEGEVVEDATHACTIFRDGIECECEPFPKLEDIQRELKGHDLACWCGVGAPCHADILLELANQ